MYKDIRDPITGLTGSAILRLADNAFIPRVRGNMDFEEFLKWEAAGNVIQPADPFVPPPPPVVPVEIRVSQLEARVAALESKA